jgi:two-component system CheB/CheR fusion protein
MKRKKQLSMFLVENHEDTLNALRLYLELQGHTVQSARDMKSALEIAPTAQFDVLISDIGLPDGNGWELLRQLSAHGPIKAIAMSGFGMNADRTKSKAAGFRAHLIKPFLIEELETALQTIVDEMAQEKPANKRGRKSPAGLNRNDAADKDGSGKNLTKKSQS